MHAEETYIDMHNQTYMKMRERERERERMLVRQTHIAEYLCMSVCFYPQQTNTLYMHVQTTTTHNHDATLSLCLHARLVLILSALIKHTDTNTANKLHQPIRLLSVNIINNRKERVSVGHCLAVCM